MQHIQPTWIWWQGNDIDSNAQMTTMSDPVTKKTSEQPQPETDGLCLEDVLTVDYSRYCIEISLHYSLAIRLSRPTQVCGFLR